VDSKVHGLRKIRIVWWASLGALLIYSMVAIFLEGLPLGEGLSALYDPFKMAAFLAIFISTLITVALPFTLFGRRYVQSKSGRKQIVNLGLLRIALAEVPIIPGLAVFVTTKSYELYLLFFLISIVALLLLKGEEPVYEDILHRLGED